MNSQWLGLVHGMHPTELASYLGHFSHARHHRLISALQQRFPWLQLLFVIHNCRLQPRWFAPEVVGCILCTNGCGITTILGA